MKLKDIKEVQLHAGFTMDPPLTGKYNNNPFFLAKAEKATQILAKHPIPEHLLHNGAV